MNKFKIFIIVITIITIMICISYNKITSYKKIKGGITIEKAKEFINEKNDYVIVSIEGISGGGVYKCETGKYKGKYVKLIGEYGTYPSTNCSSVITWPKQNKFLIKTKNVKENITDYEMYQTELDIICETYEFIIPIRREYCYSEHERNFYPKKYIDEYDVLNGDYKK